jgi:hypothetical protein
MDAVTGGIIVVPVRWAGEGEGGGKGKVNEE